MQQPVKYIMLGGFLGAGKTTTMARLARDYLARGLKVGLVTNDQATDLVDTNSLRAQGFDVGEVAGACFCCHFNELTDTIHRLSAAERPDIILAEPVGSCTDLVATVIQPLKHLFAGEFQIAPYAVILKPGHGEKILGGGTQSGFSPKAAYILEKQLEEADVILLNRADELSAARIRDLSELVRSRYPDTPLLCVSARTGLGFDALHEFLDQTGEFGRRILDIDYDIYAAGEAELGWLNSSLTARSDQPFSLDDLLLRIVVELQRRLAAIGAEAAHLKTIGLWEGFFGVANLISSDVPPELSLPSRCNVREAEVIVNARVACDPETLETLVHDVVRSECRRLGADPEFRQTQSFRPGRPQPTHRIAAGAAR